MILITIFVCFCLASAFNYFKTRKQRAFITNLKGPFTFPLWGSMQKVFILSSKNYFKKSQNYLTNFGTLSRCWVFDRLFIPTADYEFVTQLLQHADYTNTGYNLPKLWLNGSLLLSDGDSWQNRRKLISHFFQPNFLETAVEIFTAESNILVERLRCKSKENNSFDVHNFVSKAVLDIVIASTLGIKGDAQTEEISEYAKTVEDLTEILMDRFFHAHSANNITYATLRPFTRRRLKRMIKTINHINHEIIEEYRVQSLNNKLNNNNNFTIRISNHKKILSMKHTTLLDILLGSTIASESLTNEEISSEINTFLYQGYLFTSSAISFTLVMIARHPSVQYKLYEEIQKVWPTDCFYSVNELKQLKYLECVIKETLRLYPSEPIICRELNKNFEYTHSVVGDGIIPAGAEIYISIFHMLRDEMKFDNPTTFMPERYFDIDSNNTSNLTAFSMGPRNCPAQNFSMLLMKCLIAQLLTAYEILPYGDEMRLEVKIVLKSSNGFQIGLKPR
ncbi:probable cytochrome P450 316a1 [Teleopsis dalmanni]|uniref:probable cytochrome P450 316a1 n=1 Tax=Teleopsis dalmanni TaxID=139649 RepID=UPI0018CCC08B|nr:probable cytochrome P450 316a1 [Teleopsis dalmanni]